MRWFVLTLSLLFAGDIGAGESFNLNEFDTLLSPFVKKHCVSCHNAEEAEGGLDLSAFKKAEDLLARRKPWQRVVRQLKAGAMPPEGEPRPNEKQLNQVIAWLEQALVYVDPSKPVGSGRGMGFSDRTELDRITAAVGKRGFGFRDLIHEIVQSDLFQTK